ncbi:MAG: alpha/beta hydrolase, partial [Clostridia bacterium]|nr:alpha/beta hydrolase [Clostridia bacterium]
MNFITAIVKKQLYRSAYRGADGWQQWLDTLTAQGGFSSLYRPAKGVDYARMTVAGVPVERWANEGARGDLVYLHGGMYTCPLTDGYRRVAEYIALRTGRVVYAPDYAVFPNVYPVALTEVKAVWAALDLKDPILLGDDAGGNLATVLTMQLRDEGGVMPAQLLLISPLTDATCSGESYYDNFYLDPIGGQKALGGKDVKEGVSASPLWRYAGDLPAQSSRVSPLWGRLQ